MPVIIQSTLPARSVLESENIFVMGKTRAIHQDIRPLKLAILNLMPTKIVTETQLLRLLSNSALQVDVTLLHMNSHESKNTPEAHLLAHYVHFEQVRNMKFDGLVITGAPVEDLAFEDVDYWTELQEILDWSETNVYSTFQYLLGSSGWSYTTAMVSRNTRSQRRCSVSFNTGSCLRMRLCCAALMISSMRRIRGTLKSGVPILSFIQMWISFLNQTKLECISSPPKIAGIFISPDIRNTIH